MRTAFEAVLFILVFPAADSPAGRQRSQGSLFRPQDGERRVIQNAATDEEAGDDGDGRHAEQCRDECEQATANLILNTSVASVHAPRIASRTPVSAERKPSAKYSTTRIFKICPRDAPR